MNNKKIIFGILLFCAISFIAYTFANPAEKEDGEGKLTLPSSNEVTGTKDPDDNDDNSTEIDGPTVVEPVEPSTDNNNSNNAIAQDTKKSNEEIAREVIAGKWGNGQDRNKRLKDAGYDPVEIQKIVDRLLGSGSSNNNGGQNNNSGSNTSTSIEVSGVSISVPTNTKLIPGGSLNLGAAVSPSNATNKNLTYKSSNTNAVSVDANGNIKAINPGTSTITVTANNGVSNEILIVVLGNITSSAKIYGTSSNLNITSGANSSKLVGTLNKNSQGYYDGDITVQITVPSEYTEDMLKNIRYEIAENYYDVSPIKYSGINQINNLSGLSNGNAYITAKIVFNEAVVEANGKVNIEVDWIGIGSPTKYTFDFSGITLK